MTDYELVFTMPGDPCDSLTNSVDTSLSDLEGLVVDGDVVLTWNNHLTYAGIEITRDGVVIESSLDGALETYTDTNPPASGISTYTAVSTDGVCVPARVDVNLNRRRITGPSCSPTPSTAETVPNLNASTDGKSGTLGALNYTGRTIGGSITLDVNSNALRVNGEVNGTSGALVYINDHNFVDASIVAGGGFAVMVDLTAYSSAGSSRQMSVGVGQSLAELGAQSGADPANHASDLVVAYRNNTSVVALEISKHGVKDEAETVVGGLPDIPTTMRIEYILSSFDAGSVVSYNVFFDDDVIAFASGTFTWSGTGENYISLASNLSNDSRFDNVEISGGIEIEDNDPPTPNPMTWATPPTAESYSSLTMTATTASDASPVEYFFTCTAGGGHDSGWQNSTMYTDVGLAPETTYTYTVMARDKSSNQNATGVSDDASATTGTAPADVAIAGVDFENDADTAFNRTPDDLNPDDGISVSSDWTYVGAGQEDVKLDNSANAAGTTSGSFVGKLNGGSDPVFPSSLPSLTPTDWYYSWSITIPEGVVLNLSEIIFDLRQERPPAAIPAGRCSTPVSMAGSGSAALWGVDVPRCAAKDGRMPWLI